MRKGKLSGIQISPEKIMEKRAPIGDGREDSRTEYQPRDASGACRTLKLLREFDHVCQVPDASRFTFREVSL